MSGAQPPITPNKTGTLQHLLKKLQEKNKEFVSIFSTEVTIPSQ